MPSKGATGAFLGSLVTFCAVPADEQWWRRAVSCSSLTWLPIWQCVLLLASLYRDQLKHQIATGIFLAMHYTPHSSLDVAATVSLPSTLSYMLTRLISFTAFRASCYRAQLIRACQITEMLSVSADRDIQDLVQAWRNAHAGERHCHNNRGAAMAGHRLGAAHLATLPEGGGLSFHRTQTPAVCRAG